MLSACGLSPSIVLASLFYDPAYMPSIQAYIYAAVFALVFYSLMLYVFARTRKRRHYWPLALFVFPSSVYLRRL